MNAKKAGYFYSQNTIDAFRSVVLNHLKTSVSDEQWQELRGLSGTNKEITRDELVNNWFVEGNLSINDILTGPIRDQAEEIGRVDGSPVFFIKGGGIYAWGKPNASFSLDVWITWPAYPPIW